MAARQGVSIGNSALEVIADIRDFVISHAPVPAKILDVAAGTGQKGLPLAMHGYEISLFEPASAFLEAAYQDATSRGIGDSIGDTVCGTFKDLPKIKDDAYDVLVCLGAVLYVHPRHAAEDVLANLSRISSRGVVVDVASKYGSILQLGAEGAEVTVEGIEQLLNTGVAPPASAENRHVVYSCFSSAELVSVLTRFGLRVERLVGHDIPGTLDQATAKLLPASELS
jgi:ubiquinone/menaquinone biosynthesis C-methylase UbiE